MTSIFPKHWIIHLYNMKCSPLSTREVANSCKQWWRFYKYLWKHNLKIVFFSSNCRRSPFISHRWDYILQCYRLSLFYVFTSALPGRVHKCLQMLSSKLLLSSNLVCFSYTMPFGSDFLSNSYLVFYFFILLPLNW